VLNPDNLAGLLMDDTNLQDMLLVHLPEALQTRDELFAFIRSPQFQTSVDELAKALETETMYPILQDMGVNPSLAPGPGADGFLAALVMALSKKPSVVAAAKPSEEDLDADLYD